MDPGQTIRALSKMTDGAAFERLATAILREAQPKYSSLLHTGVNQAGKATRGLVDAIGFTQDSTPPQIIIVHHTTVARRSLRGKWLHDPRTVKRKLRRQRIASPGDVVKTAVLLEQERRRLSGLRCTLVLTTNCEPSEKLARDVHAYATDRGFQVDIWSVSRLAHFLDNDESGQWLRQQHLGINQQKLSRQLLAKLSHRSLNVHRPSGDPYVWISRELDRTIADAGYRDVLFVIAGSGLGKSVACYKTLVQYVTSGGFGLFLPHQAIAGSLTVEQAIDMALRQLHPHLTQTAGRDALALCSSDRPILLVVEDVKKSGQARVLVEKLARWTTDHDEAALPRRSSALVPSQRKWKLLCPLQPTEVASLDDEVRKHVERHAIIGNVFEPSEGRDAVQRRARSSGLYLSDLEAGSISAALGHDPLLIALREQTRFQHSKGVIDEFINGSVSRVAQNHGERTASDYRLALRMLASVLIVHRELSPCWKSVSVWLAKAPDELTALRHLVVSGEVVRPSGFAPAEVLSFRHDRVRDTLFVDAMAEMLRADTVTDDVLGDPYFAEVIGAALLRDAIPEHIVERVRNANPLALLYALRLFREPVTPFHHTIVDAIDHWIEMPETHSRRNDHLRSAALTALFETESSKAIAILQRFRDRSLTKWQALFRNGDLTGGLQLCLFAEPGVGALWRDLSIEHAKIRFGTGLRRSLDRVLRSSDLSKTARVGALRLTGYLTDPQLAEAIEASWNLDGDRNNHLSDYLWAAAQSCGREPDRFLDPICNAWAALPSAAADNEPTSPREELAGLSIRFAFQDLVPVSAISYFIKRAATNDLRWPITYMLHGIDHPDAIEFVVRAIAEIDRGLVGADRVSPFAVTASGDWARAERDERRRMSFQTRDRLLALWQNRTNDQHTRGQAFRFWAAVTRPKDLDVLRAIEPEDDLADAVLWQRLRRSDHTARPALIAKLKGGDRDSWWRVVPFIWSSELLLAVEEELWRRGTSIIRDWDTTFGTDHAIGELMMNLPQEDAEALLVKHWDHLRFSPPFVQAALYIATPRLLDRVKQTVASCPNPADLFSLIHTRYSLRATNRSGITSPAQIEALRPYIQYFDEHTIYMFWDTCNKRGWFDLRKRQFDSRLSEKYSHGIFDDGRIAAAFDNLIETSKIAWTTYRVEDMVNSGVAVDHLMEVLENWLSTRISLDALRLAALVIVHSGSRLDLDILNIPMVPESGAEDLIADTRFAVKRRRLH